MPDAHSGDFLPRTIVVQKGMPFVKGHVRTGGRAPGTPNHATAEIKAMALKHLPVALAELARIAAKSKNDATRVAAIKELLDRGIGRAPAAPDDNDEAVGRIVRFLTGFSNVDGGPKRG